MSSSLGRGPRRGKWPRNVRRRSLRGVGRVSRGRENFALRGCNPKKVLIHAATLQDHLDRNRCRLTEASFIRIPWGKLIEFERTFVEPIPANAFAKFKPKGTHVVRGESRFIGPRTVASGDRCCSPHWASGRSTRNDGKSMPECSSTQWRTLKLAWSQLDQRRQLNRIRLERSSHLQQFVRHVRTQEVRHSCRGDDTDLSGIQAGRGPRRLPLRLSRFSSLLICPRTNGHGTNCSEDRATRSSG